MIVEINYYKYILDDGSTPLRVLVRSKTETLTQFPTLTYAIEDSMEQTTSARNEIAGKPTPGETARIKVSYCKRSLNA